MSTSLSAYLALSWNVFLPIGLITLAVVQYKISQTNQFFHWRGKAYFSFWARKVGGLTQIGFLLLVPLTSIIQIYRYLSKGPPDILDRIQLLYRPCNSASSTRINNYANRSAGTRPQVNIGPTIANIESQIPHEDSPPKYTPPPSYTTATGARLAKILRQSVRRSVRRILGETSSRARPTIPITTTTTSIINDGRLPPEYSVVLTNPSGSCGNQQDNIEIGPRVLYNSYTQRTLSLGRPNTMPPSDTVDFIRPSAPLTANDVAHILRSSLRMSQIQQSQRNKMDNILRTTSLRNKLYQSAENLVLNAAPLGESSAIDLNSSIDGKNEENTSVI